VIGERASSAASDLRGLDFDDQTRQRVELNPLRGLKGAMRAADRSGASYAVVLGDRDVEDGGAQLKDLADGEQVALPLADLVITVKEKLS